MNHLSILSLAVSLLALPPPDRTAPLKVHLIGAGEYKPVESLTEFKKHLEGRYRVEVTTSFGKDGKSLPDLKALKTADVLVIFARRMSLPDDQMALLRGHWEEGKPVVALRTACHAFQPADNAAFGKVLGGDYQGPGSYTAPFRAVPVPEQKDHPVLRGVGPIASRGCYRFGRLADGAVVLQVVEADKKVLPPVSWVHTYKGARIFYSTMGVPEDFRDENFRRLLGNAILWAAQRDEAGLRRSRPAPR